MTERIEHITIVGGGTAGWMAAAYLVTELNRRAEGPPVRITVIESPRFGTVAVGEATVPAMPFWLRNLGISETDFMRWCDASFKLAVRFVGWNRGPDGKPLDFFHPFDLMEDTIFGFSPAYHFHKFGSPSGTNDFSEYWSPMPALIRNMRGPKTLASRDYDATVRYAYHLDAGLFAEYLQGIALSRGVEHVQDDMVDVELGEDGLVAALQLQDRGRWPVELVLDCTGFRSLILQKALGVPFESYDKYLLNDRALALRLPHQDPSAILPATTSTALGAGWVWRVPLHSRVGTGYVFSSAFRSDDEAIAEFLDHLGPGAAGAEPRAIAMRVGRARQGWFRNCIALGLSSGFAEPLESTAIYLIDMGLKWLVNYFPDKGFDPALGKRYNALMEQLYTEIRDFIALHYCTSNRTDSPYWQAVRSELEVPDSLQEQLDVLNHALPNSDDFERGLLFSYISYIIVLFGKRHFDGVRFTAEQSISRADWESWMRHIGTITDKMVRELPGHHQLLSAIRERADQQIAEEYARAAGAGGPAASPGLAPVIKVADDVALPGGNLL